MKSPLGISEERIKKDIKRGFEIEVNGIYFIPAGACSWIYRCQDDTDKKWIIKIQKTRPSRADSAVVRSLYSNGYQYLPKIILSKKGKLWYRRRFLYYSLQEYVDLEDGSDEFKIADKHLPALGRALRDFHDAPFSRQIIRRLPKETYTPKFCKAVVKVMRQVEKGKYQKYPEIEKMLLAHKESINKLLKESKKLGKKLRKQNHTQVVVHHDVHPHNILRTKNGKVYLIDWDQLRVSHQEEDLMYFDDRQITLISNGYGKDLLKNRTAVMYFRYHLKLRELWFFSYKKGVKGESEEDRAFGRGGVRDVCRQLEEMMRHFEK